MGRGFGGSMRTTFIRSAAIIIAGAALLDARAARPQLTSKWRDKAIVIDGSDAEWPGPLQPIDEKQLVAVGAGNDRQSLYLVLTTSDRGARMQVMREGLIVWFDPEGKDRKGFGIEYPVGTGPSEEGSGGRGGRPRQGAGGSPPAESLEPPNRLVLHGPKKDDARSLVADKVPGVEVKIGQVEGALVYELKLPLQKTADVEYAIGARPGSLVSVGLETPKAKNPSHDTGGMPGGMSGGMGGRGGGGRSGGGGTGRGGMGGGGQGGDAAPKPIRGWAALQLAKD